MIYNKKMKKYLSKITINSELNELVDDKDLNILQGTSYNGEHFFYFENNCCNVSCHSSINFTGEELTQLEWDCNELYINSSEDNIVLIQTGLATVKTIKANLKTRNPSQAFDIVMSFDEGENCGVYPSITIRFYTIRNNTAFISHDEINLDGFNQPVLIEEVR